MLHVRINKKHAYSVAWFTPQEKSMLFPQRVGPLLHSLPRPLQVRVTLILLVGRGVVEKKHAFSMARVRRQPWKSPYVLNVGSG